MKVSTPNYMYIGDQEKVALSVLCKALLKKSVENAIVYIYEECKVKYV